MAERRRRFLAIWVCGLSVFAAACGGDGGDGEGARCVVEALTAGTYAFEVSKVTDKCAGGAVGDLIDEGPYVFTLPSYGELQTGPVDVIADVPGIGTAVLRFELEGDQVTISLPGGAEIVPVPLLPECQALVTAHGSLCPSSETEVKAVLVITLENLVGTCGPLEPDTPCDVTVQLEGIAQAG